MLTLGISADKIKGSHSITVDADIKESDIKLNDELQAVILPGGMPGTLNLEKSDTVQRFVDFAAENNLVIGAAYILRLRVRLYNSSKNYWNSSSSKTLKIYNNNGSSDYFTCNIPAS